MKLRVVDEAFSVQSKPPIKQPYIESRRKHLTRAEVSALVKAASATGRYGERDALMVLMAYAHGLRASELVEMRWEQIDMKKGTITVLRKKNGNKATHDLKREELKALRKAAKDSPFVFNGERGPLTERAFFKIVQRAGEVAQLEFEVHPHMLRHAAGYELVNNNVPLRVIQDYLGHVDIKHTCEYTKLSSVAFRGIADIL